MDQKLPFERTGRETVAIREESTDPASGRPPSERPMDELLRGGIVNLDKPAGITSFRASEIVRKILRVKKSGHSGTLDPAVTGVLPVGLGRATKVLGTLLAAGKEYAGTMRLHGDVGDDALAAAFDAFTGTITQTPPVKSRVKREPRKRTVYYLDLVGRDGKTLEFRTGVQAGTYIRKLCHDMGEHLGTGAHMTGLRRTKAGPFAVESAVTLDEIEAARDEFFEENNEQSLRKIVQPLEAAVSHLPKVRVFDSTVDSLTHGAALNLPGVSKFETGIGPGDVVAVVTLKGELVALGAAAMASDEMRSAVSGLAVRMARVVMEPGTYPPYRRDA